MSTFSCVSPWTFTGAHGTNRVLRLPSPSNTFKGERVYVCLGEVAGRVNVEGWVTTGPVPAVVLPHGGLHQCSRAQGGTSTAEEPLLLLSNVDHNHWRGWENRLESRLPLPLDSPSRTGGDTKAGEPGVCSQREPPLPTVLFHTGWKMPHSSPPLPSGPSPTLTWKPRNK